MHSFKNAYSSSSAPYNSEVIFLASEGVVISTSNIMALFYAHAPRLEANALGLHV